MSSSSWQFCVENLENLILIDKKNLIDDVRFPSNIKETVFLFHRRHVDIPVCFSFLLEGQGEKMRKGIRGLAESSADQVNREVIGI